MPTKIDLPNIEEIFKDSFLSENKQHNDVITNREIELLFEHRLFKCFLPESLGGLGLGLPETLRVIEEASFINGSLGWLIQIGNGGMYFVTNFEEEKAIELFSPKNAVIAGSGTSTCVAEAVSGGYHVSGTWKYCSGSDYATLFTVTFTTSDTGEVISAVVPREKVTILNDWDTLGMRNTSTNSIRVDQLFIPTGNVFKVSERKSFLQESVLGLPFLLYAQAFFIHVVFGIFKHMLTEAFYILANKDPFWKENYPSRYSKLDKLVYDGFTLLEAAKVASDKIVLEVIDSTYMSYEDREKIMQQEFVKYVGEIRSHAHSLYSSLGIEVVYRSHPIAICYLDLLSASQHKLLND